MNMQTEKTSTELRFMMTCCKAMLSKNDKETIHHALEHQTLQDKELITLSYKHSVLPLLYKTLKTLVPAHPLTHMLKVHYMGIVQKNMAMFVQLITLNKLLESNNIPVLSFKGTTLSQLAYGDISLRQYGDLDVLIHKKDREKMLSVLKDKGYIPEIHLSLATQQTFLKSVNVLGFQTPSKDCFIEIHWELLSKNYAVFWEEETLWGHHSSIDIRHHTLSTLSTEHTLLYLCTHGSKHLYERLIWVCDIDRLLRTQTSLNWNIILSTARTLGMYRMLLLSLCLCQTLLDTPLKEQIQHAIKKDKKVAVIVARIITLHFTYAKKESKSYRTFGILWNMREKMFHKLRFTYFALFYPRLHDFKAIQLPYYLAFIYPLLRPFRLLRKYFR